MIASADVRGVFFACKRARLFPGNACLVRESARVLFECGPLEPGVALKNTMTERTELFRLNGGSRKHALSPPNVMYITIDSMYMHCYPEIRRKGTI